MLNQAQMFEPESVIATDASAILSFDQKVERTVNVIKSLLRNSQPLNIATSYGKDSSVLLNLFLTAAVELKHEGVAIPQCMVMTSNTLIENPEMDMYVKEEIKKVDAFVKKHGLENSIEVSLVTPSRSNHYLVNIIGGRTVATVAEMGDSKCSDMVKVSPLNKAKKRFFREYGIDNVVTLIGKRTDESAHRAANMKARGENPEVPVKNERGELILSPIADFTIDDIFEYIAYARNDMIESYSDFEKMLEIYRDSNGGVCELVIAATGKSSAAGCGARHGCYLCLRTEDRSMENLLQEDKYAYMKPLNDFRNYIRAHHFNPEKRNWISRTVNEDGTVTIAPNAYSPDFCKDLLRMALTIDANERETAWELGIEPRFQMLTMADVVQVQLLWSRYGYTESFEACQIFHDVNVKGLDYPVPTDEPVYPLANFPKGSTNVPFADADYGSVTRGFRNINLAMIDQEATIEKNGILYSDCLVDDEFIIDEEGAELFFQFELEHVLGRYGDNQISPTHAFHYFVQLGTVRLFKGSHSEVDRMLRMANQIHALGIRGILNNPEALVEALAGTEAQVSNSQPDLFVSAA